MPRVARIDIPGVLYHVIVRGIVLRADATPGLHSAKKKRAVFPWREAPLFSPRTDFASLHLHPRRHPLKPACRELVELAYSGRLRPAFRSDCDRDSGVIATGIPTGLRPLFRSIGRVSGTFFTILPFASGASA